MWPKFGPIDDFVGNSLWAKFGPNISASKESPMRANEDSSSLLGHPMRAKEVSGGLKVPKTP